MIPKKNLQCSMLKIVSLALLKVIRQISIGFSMKNYPTWTRIPCLDESSSNRHNCSVFATLSFD